MNAARAIAKRASTSHPCPVCAAGSKGCSVTDDELHLCRGEPHDPSQWKLVKRGDDFNSYRRAEDKRHLDNGHYRADPKPVLGLAKDWNSEAAKYAKSLNPDARAELARELGLPVAALDAFPLLGWFPDHRVNSAPGDAEPEWNAAPCWTFPQMDARGKIVGIARRFRDKIVIGGGNPTNKAAMAGGAQGLFVPAGWREKPGPLFIVEGASDAMALSAAGLAAIGRPSNTGGGDRLVELLKDLPPDRSIIVLAENDEREKDGKLIWPGKVGAEVLRAKLKRPVRIVFPPAEFKDARLWALDLAAGFAEAEDWPAIGKTILEHCDREAAKGSRFTFIDAHEFLHADYHREFLIKRILVRGDYGLIAGPPKSLKTSIAVDAAVSLATCHPFLGEFDVVRPTRVALISGESGRGTIQETMWRILREKGLGAESFRGRLQLEFTLPKFLKLDDVMDFAESLKRLEVEVAIIDPLYLCMGGEIDHANFIEMGEALDGVADQLRCAGVQPIIVHHANRQLKHGATMELQHLSYSGTDTYARQWILLNRQSAYQGDGKHPLILSAGGSAGHGGLWNLDIEEGVVDEHFQGRFWSVKVSTPEQSHAERIDQREASKIEIAKKKTAHEQACVLLAIDAECSGHAAATKTAIKDRTGYGTPKVGEVLNALIELGRIEEHEFEKQSGHGAKTPAKGFRRVPTER